MSPLRIFSKKVPWGKQKAFPPLTPFPWGKKFRKFSWGALITLVLRGKIIKPKIGWVGLPLCLLCVVPPRPAPPTPSEKIPKLKFLKTLFFTLGKKTGFPIAATKGFFLLFLKSALTPFGGFPPKKAWGFFFLTWKKLWGGPWIRF